MSKFVKGLLIGLGVLLVIALLAWVGFQIYAMVAHGQVARVRPIAPMMPRFWPRSFGYGQFGFHGGGFPFMRWFPFGGLIGVLGLGLLAALVIVALTSPGGRAATRVCARCGRGLEAGWIACPHCGQPVEPPASVEQASSDADPATPAPAKRGRTKGGASA